MTRSALRPALLLLPLVSIACVEPTPPAANPDEPDGPGDTLSEVAWSGNTGGLPSLVFSHDGNELFAVLAPPSASPSIAAINTTTRAVRTLATMPCCAHSLALSPDGSTLYFVAATSRPADIERIPAAGGPRTLIVRAHVPYVLSANGQFLAYATQPVSLPDSIIRIDLGTGARLAMARPGGYPAALAPDGSEILTSTVGSDILTRRHERWAFAGGSRGVLNEQVISGAAVSTRVTGIVWLPDTLRLLLFETASFSFAGTFLRRTVPGSGTTTIATVPMDFINLATGGEPPAHAWSRTGSRLAVWLNAGCVNGTPGPTCVRSQYVLYLIDQPVSVAEPRALAVIESSRAPLGTTFSTDGQQLAYIESGRLFRVRAP